jgi:hypothetical protein
VRPSNFVDIGTTRSEHEVNNRALLPQKIHEKIHHSGDGNKSLLVLAVFVVVIVVLAGSFKETNEPCVQTKKRAREWWCMVHHDLVV